ncbi:YdiU family protein [Erythrobacteraceae bacterium CFH 75059]|uniref:protein adenylyltransferase SelO family protein n=1 Tax=Qipengyuania thermophila TaxID=2509361 RepID=UPI00101F2501|nr:YdiU family protein [Qipengyuania thermophila]TCD04957.1 YdiU family protein [Erythrobacteraceae bacterium CFH 75059]
MHADAPPAPYRPCPALAELAHWIGDVVEPAQFPAPQLRLRNDLWAAEVGLSHLDDTAWLDHFAAFRPLPGNLSRPLALRYHGHQFRVYNPEIGDGRGFLFAQLRDREDRLLDLGTKGSGRTPYSRTADGRLTLQGAVREWLATEHLHALGVNTSKTFAIIETGEALERHDEPSPTRAAVLTRLSHGHIRIGTFQRLFVLGETEHLAALVDYCRRHFPGPAAPDTIPDAALPAVEFLYQVVERLADLAASYMVAGFVHGVLNTDNMNVTGESFDYGPWRFLPRWEPGFTAAYFDHAGLYAFGRQPEAISWNCGQLAVALQPLAPAAALVAVLEQFQPLYRRHLGRRWCWRLGHASRDAEADEAVVRASVAHMIESGEAPDRFFWRARQVDTRPDAVARALARHEVLGTPDTHASAYAAEPPMLVHAEVERLWNAIATQDDWAPLRLHVERTRAFGRMLGPAPAPAGHVPAGKPQANHGSPHGRLHTSGTGH